MSTDQQPVSEVQHSANKVQITSKTKEKDPKRVAAGKKLAAYSKAAREKQKNNFVETQPELDDPQMVPEDDKSESSIGLTKVLGVAGLCVAVVGVYYTYAQAKETEKLNEFEQKHHPEPTHEIPKQQPTKSKLRSFD